MNDFDFENEIIELDSDNKESKSSKSSSEIENLEDDYEPKTPKPKRKKKSIKDKWDDLAKKQKILIISGIVIGLLIIIGLILYFVFFKKDNANSLDNNDKNIDNVVIEKDNYRYDKGNLVFLDKNDRELGTYECTNKDSSKCYVAKLAFSDDKFERIKNVNTKGIEIEKNSNIYYDQYVFVTDGEELFLYDITSKKKDLELKKIKAYGTTRNFVVIEDTSLKYGLIDEIIKS